MSVMKNVEAVGICCERTTAIEAGSDTRLVTAETRPEVRVMTKKVCYRVSVFLPSMPSMEYLERLTHNNEEDKVPRHQIQLDLRLTRDPLEPRK